jgi:C1A family cysteine protease
VQVLFDEPGSHAPLGAVVAHPMIFGTNLYESFYTVKSDGLVPVPNVQTERVIGAHAMLVVGYTKDAFIVRNSWGTAWGDNGYCYFPIAYIDSFVQQGGMACDCWVIKDQTNLFKKEIK